MFGRVLVFAIEGVKSRASITANAAINVESRGVEEREREKIRKECEREKKRRLKKNMSEREREIDDSEMK